MSDAPAVPLRLAIAGLGMTRMGKSNTMKTLAVATYRHAKRFHRPRVERSLQFAAAVQSDDDPL